MAAVDLVLKRYKTARIKSYVLHMERLIAVVRLHNAKAKGASNRWDGWYNGCGGGKTMTEVEAIYQSGVFKPLQSLDLAENQRVRLRVQPIQPHDALAWLAAVQQRQQRIIAQRGHFPDSAPEIAEDRRR